MNIPRVYLAVFGLLGMIFTTSCYSTPGAATPPAFFTLDAVVTVDARDYPVQFTWRNYDNRTWNEGLGFHYQRLSSAHSVLRIVDERVALVLRLPFRGQQEPFRPSVIVVDPSDLTTLWEYRELAPGVASPGRVQLKKFLVTESAIEPAPQPMTKQERALRETLREKGYATVRGRAYSASEWQRFAPLRERFEALRELTPLGLRPGTTEGSTGRLATQVFSRAQQRPVLLGFQWRDGAWSESTPGTAQMYRAGFASVVRQNQEKWRLTPTQLKRMREKGEELPAILPIALQFRGRAADLTQDDMWFDPARQELVQLHAAELARLDVSEIRDYEDGKAR